MIASAWAHPVFFDRTRESVVGCVAVAVLRLTMCVASMGKEREANHKEYAQQFARIEKMKADNKDPYDIKKQVGVFVFVVNQSHCF
jgi:hypothetical protein